MGVEVLHSGLFFDIYLITTCAVFTRATARFTYEQLGCQMIFDFSALMSPCSIMALRLRL